MQDEKMVQGIPAEKAKKKPGRRPMTPEEKATASKARAEEKAKAERLKPEIFVQYRESEISIDVLADAAKEDFRTTKKRTPVTDMKLYVKPEEYTAYYVINGGYEGKIPF